MQRKSEQLFKKPENLDIGKYIVQKPNFIGKGQYGLVYRCEMKSNPALSLCAKVLQQKDVEPKLIKRETEILKLLMEVQSENENLVKVYDVIDEDRKNLYLIMEYCNGGDLKMLMDEKKKTGWFTVAEAINLVKQVAKGYSALHSKKILHRDIKPANILIKEGVVKIGDLGMGRIIEDMNFAQNFTKVGTPAYAAPQLYLDNKFSSKADVYSLGIIFYQLIYKKLPIEAKTQPEHIEKLKILEVNPLVCPEESENGLVPRDVRSLIESMLMFREEDRASWMDIFKSEVLQLNILNHTKERRLTLTSLQTLDYQQYFLVNEVSNCVMLQIARILMTKAFVIGHISKALEQLKSSKGALEIPTKTFNILAVCLSGYKFKLVLNIIGLLFNQPEQVAPQIQQLINAQNKGEFKQLEQQEEVKLLKEYVQKQLSQTMLQFREDECRFINILQNKPNPELKELADYIENEDCYDFTNFSRIFANQLKTIHFNVQPNQPEQKSFKLLAFAADIDRLWSLDQCLIKAPKVLFEQAQIY